MGLDRTDRVLVTGGAGFIGSHLCERLLGEGLDVICLDNFLSGTFSNVQHLRGQVGFELVEHDIGEPYRPAGRIAAVLHLASPASPRAYQTYPIETIRAGTLGTMNAVEIARKHGATFLLASTSEVYGDPEVHPQPESYRGSVSTTGPRSVYDEAKRCAETIAAAYHRTHGVDVRIARIFNTYGPRLAPGDGRAVANMVVQALGDRPLTIYGDGSQTRSFCYVDDMVSGLLALLATGDAAPTNLGNPDERSISELAALIVELTGSSSEVTFEPLPIDDPRVRCPDIARARRVLGWAPAIPLEEGLMRTIEWFRNSEPPLVERAGGRFSRVTHG